MRYLCLLLLSVGLAACGEPLLVIGDLPGFMRIVAGVPQSGFGSIDTVGVMMRLDRPIGVAVNDSGTVFIGDQSIKLVRVEPNGRARVLHRSTPCFTQPRNCLMRPHQMVMIGGDLLIADNQSERIWRMNATSGALSTFAGTGTGGFTPDGTPASQASLTGPAGLAVGDDGRVFISESGSNRIRVVGADGILRTFAGTGSAGRAGDGGPATSAQLYAPGWITIANNTLYIADSGNHLIRTVDLVAGTIQTLAGTGVAGFSGDNGPALEANLFIPWAMAVAPDGETLFFSELGNHRVRAVGLATGRISTFAGTGATAFNGNGRAAAETALNQPTGLVASPEGFLYIADTGHGLVWRTPVRF